MSSGCFKERCERADETHPGKSLLRCTGWRLTAWRLPDFLVCHVTDTDEEMPLQWTHERHDWTVIGCAGLHHAFEGIRTWHELIDCFRGSFYFYNQIHWPFYKSHRTDVTLLVQLSAHGWTGGQLRRITLYAHVYPASPSCPADRLSSACLQFFLLRPWA